MKNARLEMHEGLAEYTGLKLSGNPEATQFAVDVLMKEAPAKKTFVRSFASASGPAYGLLLDESSRDWRAKLQKEDDLGALLVQRLELNLPHDVAKTADEHAEKYDA
nr:hypothetical protein [Chthoniobacterales bacterium]